VATLVTATLVVGSVSSIVSGGVQAGASVVGGAASVATQAAGTAAAKTDSDQYGYFVDTLFRDDRPAAVSDDAARSTVTRIFVRSLSDGQLAAADRTYLAQLVAQRTNLTQADAERRVDEVYARTQKAVADAKLAAQQAADTAAKVAAWTSLWMFVALLIGAFFASFAATFGGRRRDAVVYLESDTYVTTTTLPVR
jgi:hypothetical protein